MTEYALGIDMGTSGVKVAALDLTSLRLATLAMQGYDNSPQQPSTMLWDATAGAIRSAVAGIDARAIRAISFSSQMHGTVLYDERDDVIDPIINWQDKRCDAPLDRYVGRSTVEVMRDRLADADLYDLGIDFIPSGYLGATLFHIKENEPALFDRILHVLLPGDFIRGKLLGASDHATDPTNAFGAGLFNTRLNRWHAGVIDKLGLPPGILPVVRDTAEIAGALPRDVAHSLGLAPGVPVVCGGGDNQMSLLGNGLIAGDSPALINIGTGAQVSQVTSQFARKAGIDTRSHFNGTFVFVGASMGGGRNHAQLRGVLCQREGRDIGYQEMDELASQAPVGANGLEFQLSSRGEAQRREGFVGRTELQDVGHLTRAVMEGIMLDLYRLRPPTGSSPFMVGAGKGLQKSKAWAQIAADLFDRPIRITHFENAVWGAALIAALGVGAVRDVRDAVATIQYSQQVLPDAARAAQYRDLIAQRLA